MSVELLNKLKELNSKTSDIEQNLDDLKSKIDDIEQKIDEVKVDGTIRVIVRGTLTYSDADITSTVENRDANGYITSIQYYAGATLEFTLTINRDANNRITSIVRT